MPRPPRIEQPDALYHVTSRGNGRAKVFFSDADRRRFLGQLADNVATYRVVLHAYVLMDNHFHLVVQTPEANLSRFMQRLVTSYALYARYKHKRPGHQFEGRFRAKVIQSEAYLRRVSRYVHLNPVRTAPATRLNPAARRKRLEQYPWSSYRDYIGLRPQADDIRPPVSFAALHDFGKDPAATRRAYRRYVLSALDEGDKETAEAMGASAYAIGSDDFIAAVRSQLMARRLGGPRDRDVAWPRPAIDADRIDATVAEAFGVPTARLREHGHHAGNAKKVAVELARRLTGWTQRAVGQRYGGITSQAVSQIARTFREGNAGAQAQATLTRLEEDLSQ